MDVVRFTNLAPKGVHRLQAALKFMLPCQHTLTSHYCQGVKPPQRAVWHGMRDSLYMACAEREIPFHECHPASIKRSVSLFVCDSLARLVAGLFKIVYLS